ncbi:hypothetical protein NQ318_014223 [Aromia moschata]|uniref:Major facilitator superfamily (MFS) profile domain-containing protein n=1 Tax=Aromia moschata TaxID=1265417 RepID=A0AAV8Z172_9CUCU|nr:hypothetical protein NQ318_014223 [Aromia moschata]
MARFTKRQWLTLIVIGIADFCNAICVSLQAPFYPQEAESKGCSATEYGLVFGIFELVVFLISPIYGQHLNKLGPKIAFNGGIYTTGTCVILFGLLDKVNGHYPFIILSFVIRIVEAMGNAAFLTASFAIIAQEFPNNVATTFASLETFFGLGLIIGPTVGGALYQVGGYTLPFAVMGSCLFMSAVLTAFVLPKHEVGVDRKAGPSVLTVLKNQGVLLSAISIVVTSMSIGFLQATLEPHLRKLSLPPIILGLMFVINGGTYAIIAPGFGWLCDRFNPRSTLWVVVAGLVLHGIGMAAQLVASFTDALRTSIAQGAPNNLETFGLISGLWTSSFALGAFIGPSISGILYDTIGFSNASMFIVITHLLVGIVVSLFLCLTRSQSEYICKDEDKTILNDDSVYSKSLQENISSLKSIRSVGNGISIEKSRPPGMNSLIACNSYKCQAWPRRDITSLTFNEPRSYGTTEQMNGRTAASYLQGVI